MIQKVCADNGYYKRLVVERCKYLSSINSLRSETMLAVNALRHEVGKGQSYSG